MTLPLLALALLQAAQIPAPTGLVNDFADVIPAEQEQRIARIAEDVRAKSRGEIAVVTLPNIGERDVSEIALRIGREWGVGKLGDPGDPTRNAGVVVLIVPKETSADGRGRCRIETGTGAEGFITDATAGGICRSATPFFAARDYGSGIELVTLAVAERFAAEFGFRVDTSLGAPAVAARRAPRADQFPIGQIIFMLVLIILISRMSKRGRRGRRGRRGESWLPVPIFLPTGGGGWGSGGGFGGGGGGFGGFGGGGGFSGGGGGSSW